MFEIDQRLVARAADCLLLIVSFRCAAGLGRCGRGRPLISEGIPH